MRTASTNQPVAIVLGGTFPHRELLRNLRHRGYYTILVDYLQNPSAKDEADEHVRESTLDISVVLNIARRRHAALVISTCIDQANVTACYVAEKLGLTVPYSYETALSVTNKILMKHRMVEHGIPTSRFFRVRCVEDCNKHDLKYPVIIKPCDCNSSKGVRRSDHPDDTRRFVQSALEISRCGEALIEEFKVGTEIGFDSFIKNGKANLFITRERRKILNSADTIQQIYGSLWPAQISASTQAGLTTIAEKIGRAFSLDDTPLMVQAIVNGTDISVIEFAPRIGGGENYRIIKMATGCDAVDAAIDSFLGLSPTLEYYAPEAFFADNYLYAKPGIFGGIQGGQSLVERGIIEYCETYTAEGSNIGEDMSSNNRVGVFTVKSSDAAGLRPKIRRAIDDVEVLDLNGYPIMRRDIYAGAF